jgi:hypothetical protein
MRDRSRTSLVVVALILVAPAPAAQARVLMAVQGESPMRTNIRTASDPRASGGAYLSLDTAKPPPERGWYATYKVKARSAGVYRLEAVTTSPVEQRNEAEIGSEVNLSINGGPAVPVARSQPAWAGAPSAWGDLHRMWMADVQLRRGTNTVRFMVNERAVLSSSVRYRFLLDRFNLAPTALTIKDVSSLSGKQTQVRFRLNGRAPRPQQIAYRVTDYFARVVGSGTTTIPAGGTAATVRLPDLPPGNYRATASLSSAPRRQVTGYFARLPEQRPVGDRFGVNTFAFSLVPPSKLDAVASALKEMGVGYVRDGDSWPAAQPKRGPYDKRAYARVTRTFHRHGLKTLEVMSAPPDWAMTPTSVPLPADLRDAYRYANHLAGTRSDAIQLSNEPDVDDTQSTGDQHAAYVKAAALGIADRRRHRPLIVLPGIASAGPFQDLMLRNEVVGYADAWGFHGYPGLGDDEDPDFPDAADEQHRLRRRHAARTAMWMTESGIFLRASSSAGLTWKRQVNQARYLVRSAVQDLAAGTERHFWFVGPPTFDDGIYFSMLNENFQPWPAYSAHAAMSSILGEANFVRRLRGLPRGASGYTFSNKGQAVTVLWAAKPTDVRFPGEHAAVYDIMGARRKTSPGHLRL